MKHERIRAAHVRKPTGLANPIIGLGHELVELLGENGALRPVRERSWASATFAGLRIFFEAKICCEDAHRQAENVKAKLPSHEFTLSGHFVAEISIKEIQYDNDENDMPIAILQIEALTIEDR